MQSDALLLLCDSWSPKRLSNALNNNNYINNGENNGINDPGISNSNGNGIKEKS
ncbi:19276_t:CDS:2 [Entrophospora sp. SA101]|nr:19276_t:CDS:2 [Entrophospora sp. SA101]